ncbi:unnamed protein product [Leptidea sinapis]|uniref:Secreted protein n=1 Tax=Leptidea sinapis TaxID=189913 RepID=A0A5E4QTB6_9NEOP|nr:unnamed protein product [Leptidea sinapis]
MWQEHMSQMLACLILETQMFLYYLHKTNSNNCQVVKCIHQINNYSAVVVIWIQTQTVHLAPCTIVPSCQMLIHPVHLNCLNFGTMKIRRK